MFLQTTIEGNQEKNWLGKTNFVEIRSFWQIFRSFDRMWSFFILSLQVSFKCIEMLVRPVQLLTHFLLFLMSFQAMIILACHDVGSPLKIFDAEIFQDILSIFITSAILKLIQGIVYRYAYY